MKRGSRKRSARVRYGRQLALNLPTGARKAGISKSKGSKVSALRLAPTVDESLRRISRYLPPKSRPFVAQVLTESPTEVIPVEARDSKHGDFVAVRGKPFGRITVNVCGNPYQFLLTLLHEVAHARIAARYRRRIPPHGSQWKAEFSTLLFRVVEQDFLPRDLRKAFGVHALNPKSTADYDIDLQLALRPYDTLDARLLVMDLRHGEYFSLDGKTVLKKGALVRRRIRCTATDGNVYSVLPSARVKEIYPLKKSSVTKAHRRRRA